MRTVGHPAGPRKSQVRSQSRVKVNGHEGRLIKVELVLLPVFYGRWDCGGVVGGKHVVMQ